MLENITEYEYDVVEAYRTAKDRLSHTSDLAMLQSFEDEHTEQIRQLASATRSMGTWVPRAGDWQQVLTEGKVAMASLVGELPVLTAMTHNEENVLHAYERAARRQDVPESVRAVLAMHENQARRRHSWLSERVENLSS